MIEKLYSHIFAHTNEKVREIYLKMNPDWNTNQMQRDWFNAIGSLVQNNAEIDMITIVDELRNQKTYSPQHVSKISELGAARKAIIFSPPISILCHATKLRVG